MCETGNNMSTQRIGASILAGLLGKYPDDFESVRPVLMQYCQDLRSDLRRIVVCCFPDMIRFTTDKQRVLEELRELIDDEEITVKHDAFLQLAPCLKQADPT